eukprot:1420696-Alexandrium_andersonii.AAC.1
MGASIAPEAPLGAVRGRWPCQGATGGSVAAGLRGTEICRIVQAEPSHLLQLEAPTVSEFVALLFGVVPSRPVPMYSSDPTCLDGFWSGFPRAPAPLSPGGYHAPDRPPKVPLAPAAGALGGGSRVRPHPRESGVGARRKLFQTAPTGLERCCAFASAAAQKALADPESGTSFQRSALQALWTSENGRPTEPQEQNPTGTARWQRRWQRSQSSLAPPNRGGYRPPGPPKKHLRRAPEALFGG